MFGALTPAAVLLPERWWLCELDAIARLAPLQILQHPLFDEKSLRVLIKREDLLHPLISGNKVYKLHGYLNDYLAGQSDAPIASCGGAYSNHLLALACAGAMTGIATLGVVRGEAGRGLSPTLQAAEALGMRLHFVSREHYRARYEAAFLSQLREQLGPFYWVPEGGAGRLGAGGLKALAAGIVALHGGGGFQLLHAVGTGSSLAGLVAGFAELGVEEVYSHGINVLKGCTSLAEELAATLALLGVESLSWRLVEGFHGGGYGKCPSSLASFMQEFETHSGIALDPVYTAKVMWALMNLARDNVFAPGSTVIVVHSGGLQGRADAAPQVWTKSLCENLS